MFCSGCSLTLKEPYVHCSECKASVDLCLQCFVTGRQVESHLNYHAYEIKSLNFNVFEERWSAREELCLLDATDELGFGNWTEISKKLQNKSSEECEKHYLKFYVNDSPYFPTSSVQSKKCWRRPFILKSAPYRPTPEDAHQDNLLFLSGYMAARGDFTMEYHNFSELDIKDVEFNDTCEDDDLMVELNLAVADIYFTRLQERNLRRDVLKEYGLLDVASLNALGYKHGREEKVLRDNIRKFARLVKPDEHEQLIQGVLYQKQLERKIQQLQEYRNAGLRSFRDVSFYERLKKQRIALRPKSKLLDEALLYKENPLACQVWLQRQLNRNKIVPTMPIMPPLHRKQPLPLDLVGLPGYEQLTDVEKQLCSTIRLSPEMFIDSRNMLRKESFHSDGIKLQTARLLLKMDVNKTKRVYEFCLDQGYIKAGE